MTERAKAEDVALPYRVNNDEQLVADLKAVIEQAYTAAAKRLVNVLDATTIMNIVLSITEGSDAIDKAIQRANLSRPATPPEGLREKAIKAACTATDAHLMCSFPKCACKNAPVMVDAILALAVPQTRFAVMKCPKCNGQKLESQASVGGIADFCWAKCLTCGHSWDAALSSPPVEPAAGDRLEAARTLLREKKELTGCTSYIQRKLSLTYNAGRKIMEALEAEGFISAADETGRRALTTRKAPPHG